MTTSQHTPGKCMEACSRCGQGIANVYLYRSKPYGSECIYVVTGQKPDSWQLKTENGIPVYKVRRGMTVVIDEEATAKKEQAENDRQVRVALHKATYKVAEELKRGDTYVTCLVCKETRCAWFEVGFKNSDGRCFYCREEGRSLAQPPSHK